jgi:hypothetical protein
MNYRGYNSEWWTRPRILAALRRFHEEFKCAPSSFDAYAELQIKANIEHAGRITTRGQNNLYPSIASIGKYFKYMNDAWRAIDLEVVDNQIEWTVEEDCFLFEALGILTRDEIADCLPHRTSGAVKARIKHLGWDIYSHWGITTGRAAIYLELGQNVVEKYVKNGTIPFLKGSAYTYINPADLLVIKEVDWSQPLHPELASMIRNALVKRICLLMERRCYRAAEVYKFLPKSEQRGAKSREYSVQQWQNLPPKPLNLSPGAWVRLMENANGVCTFRKGIIKSVHYSPQVKLRTDGTRRKCWIATVEFPKYTSICNPRNPKRIRTCIPLDCLTETDPFILPEREVKSKELLRKRKYSAISAKRLENRRKLVESKVAEKNPQFEFFLTDEAGAAQTV